MADNLQIGMVHGPGPAGAWDSERVSGPRVLRGTDGRWRMWYYGRDPSFDRLINLPTGRCGLATSIDGIVWQAEQGPLTMGAVLEPHADQSRFDSSHVGVSDVHLHGDVYWMWYFGGSQAMQSFGPHQVRGVDLRPGLAISRDGLRWRRIEGPHRGALLDVGAPGEFDAVMCGWPQVIHDGSDWKMYYHTLDMRRGFLVGLALSSDGLHWEKHGEVLGPGEAGAFDEQGAATRQVIRHDNRYLMFYEGVMKSGHRSIGLAVSDDGLSWRRQPGHEPNGSVFSHAPRGSGRWDAFAIGTPSLVAMDDGSWRMYYIGSNEVANHGPADEMALQHRIGLAVSTGTDLTRWRRWGE
ncbi:MAG: glycosyl hydrolase [Proteobacteria bacterium]|nr:glycosyl hydrolase [Pseudomonadota bacterium]